MPRSELMKEEPIRPSGMEYIMGFRVKMKKWDFTNSEGKPYYDTDAEVPVPRPKNLVLIEKKKCPECGKLH